MKSVNESTATPSAQPGASNPKSAPTPASETAAPPPSQHCPMDRFVNHDLCRAINTQHRDSFRLLFTEIRGLRRLVIALIIGGQLFASGAGFLSTHYWLRSRQNPFNIEGTGRAVAAERPNAAYDRVPRAATPAEGKHEAPQNMEEKTNDQDR